MILVFGVLGQVGGALCAQLGGRAMGLKPEDADFLNPSTLPTTIKKLIDRYQPQAIINAAAYTAVDQAEKDRDRAFALNATSPGILARMCAEHDIPFVHYSTDYVYPGSGDHFMTEDHPTGPLNVYGESKLAGDLAVAQAGGKHLIFRTSWVYDATGKNFVRTMLRLGQEREALKVVSDQIGSPTYAKHIAKITLQALERASKQSRFPNGVYHLCNSGVTSWHGFATEIFAEARRRGLSLKVQKVDPIQSSEFPTPARRPTNSRLSLDRLKNTFDLVPPSWQEALKECMQEIQP